MGVRKSNSPVLTQTIRRALLVVGAAPAMAEGITSIEPAGRAEKATTAKPKVWELRV
jgi:hypothetical protein